MEQVHRQGSVVPTGCHQFESTVLPVNCHKAWAMFKSFKLETVVPGKVKSTTFTTG
jgi:hypothetical protein